MYNGDTMRYMKLSDALKQFSDCRYCKHYNGNGTCKAFPKVIPIDIMNGTFDHNKKHKDDHGIRFEIDEEKTEWEDEIYEKYSKYFEDEVWIPNIKE